MFGDIRSVDRLEQEFAEVTAAMSRLDAIRLELIRELDVAQVAHADGARTMVDWVAGRFDLEAASARVLVSLARADDSALEAELEGGRITLDRAAAVADLRAWGADERTIDDSRGRDLAGVRGMMARHRRISSADQSDEHARRFLHMQPSLDESHWTLWGRLSGVDGKIVDKAIHAAADSLPHDPITTATQDRADGLVSVASAWLSGEVGGHELSTEIFVDAELASVTNGESGAAVASGPRVGPNTLAEILCSGTTRINFQDRGGVVSTSPTSRAIPGPIRSRVLHRDGYRCVIAGCTSRTRLQIHHMVPYASGGTHHLDNLITVCWYHHHIAIHQDGRKIDPESPPQRRTFLRLHPVRAGP